MKKHITKEKLLKLSPCEDGLKFAESLNFDFVKIWNQCERGDWMIWMLLNLKLAKKMDYVKISVACAEICLKNYESKYPHDDRPRKALEAAKAWIDKPTKAAARSAAESAEYAARSAAEYAARSAEYAARSAAESAARSAEYAARSAEYAARSAAWPAAWPAARKEQADMIRKVVECPFKKMASGEEGRV